MSRFKQDFFKLRDKSGTISAKEMKSVFKAMGITANDNEIKLVVKQMDVDG
jgi:Ca2+-binding EF-hand superfamily protein